MLIGVLGNKGHGKDTIADYICEKYNYKKDAFANPLKEACRILFNLSDEQLYGDQKEVVDPHWNVSPREILRHVGTEFFRINIDKLLPGIYNNFWVKCMEPRLDDNTIISDVRFQNEVNMIHEHGGVVIKVIRSYEDSKSIKSLHVSEQLDDISFDFLIHNDSTLEELYKKVDLIYKSIN